MSSAPHARQHPAPALWKLEAGHYFCRAPLWSAADAPAHIFGGRSAAPAAADSAASRRAEAESLARLLALRRLPEIRILRQEHGVTVLRAGGSTPAGDPLGDGVSTDDPRIALGVQTADCVPILLADRRRGVVAALHAGWRGTASGIVPRALDHLASEYGSSAADLEAVLGPAIGGCCYVVGEEVRRAAEAGPLRGLGNFRPAGGGRWKIDLARLNETALAHLGLAPERIQRLETCTRCAGDRLHSFRAEGAAAGRNWSFVAIGDAPRQL
jgi:hypothetical protein